MVFYIVLKLFMYCEILSATLGSQFNDPGYSLGFAPKCPGSEKKATISKKSLRHLSVVVQGSGDVLLSRKKQYNYYNINSLVKDPDFDVGRRTIAYLGGYLDSANFPIAQSMLKVYKDVGYNAIALDTNFFTTTVYPLACRNIRPVGFHFAEMLVSLTKLGLNPKRVEFIGLSLGAHTAAFTAQSFRDLTGTNISRITALDPAGPCFRSLEPGDRLDPTDADFIDHIATNIDDLGMATPTGHVNFYINGGEYQPNFMDGIWMGCDNFCRHIRSFLVWLSAVQHPNKFIGIKCDSVQEAREGKCYDRKPLQTNTMGLVTNKKMQGIFYLSTDNKYPYFMGKKGMKKEYDFWKKNLKALEDQEDIIL